MSMKSLLNDKNRELLRDREMVLKDFNTIRQSYDIYRTYVSDTQAWAEIKFNGNTRISIKPGEFIVSGFGLADAPNARISPVAGCSDEGHVSVKTLTEVANLLADYVKIFPTK